MWGAGVLKTQPPVYGKFPKRGESSSRYYPLRGLEGFRPQLVVELGLVGAVAVGCDLRPPLMPAAGVVALVHEDRELAPDAGPTP